MSKHEFSFFLPLQKDGAPRDLSDLFNWTMTYHPSSDIMEPYGAMVPLSAGGGAKGLPAFRAKHSRSHMPLRAALLDTSSATYVSYLSAQHDKKTLPLLLPSPYTRYVERETGKLINTCVISCPIDQVGK